MSNNLHLGVPSDHFPKGSVHFLSSPYMTEENKIKRMINIPNMTPLSHKSKRLIRLMHKLCLLISLNSGTSLNFLSTPHHQSDDLTLIHIRSRISLISSIKFT
jgi:hypothetical protein